MVLASANETSLIHVQISKGCNTFCLFICLFFHFLFFFVAKPGGGGRLKYKSDGNRGC